MKLLVSFLVLIYSAPLIAVSENCEESQKYLTKLSSLLNKENNKSTVFNLLISDNITPTKFNSSLDDVLDLKLTNDGEILDRIHLLEERITSSFWPLSSYKTTNIFCDNLSTEVKAREKLLKNVFLKNAEAQLRFLKFSKTKRAKILKSVIFQKSEMPTNSVSLSEDLQILIKHKYSLEKNVEGLNDRVVNQKSIETREVDKAALIIQKYRIEIVDHNLNLTSKTRDAFKKYENISSQVVAVENSLRFSNKSSLISSFDKISIIWRSLVSDSFEVYKNLIDGSKVKDVPSVEVSNELISALISKAENEKNELLISQKNKKEKSYNEFYVQFSSVSKARSLTIDKLSQLGVSNIEINKKYFGDLLKEILAIPLKLFGILIQKYSEIVTNVDDGFLGIWKTVKSVLSIVFVFFLPFLFRMIARKTRKALDSYRIKLVGKGRRQNKKAVKLAFWIQKLTAYFPLVVCYFLLVCLQNFFVDSYIGGLIFIIPIVRYYIVYKAFRILVTDLLGTLQNIGKVEGEGTRNLIDLTSSFIGYFFLSSFIVLYLTRITVDQGLLYRLMTSVINGVGLIVFVIASFWWRKYLSPAVRGLYENKFGIYLSKKCDGVFGFLFCFPTLLFVLLKLISNVAWDWLSEFEVSKRFLAKVYRKKVEALSSDTVVKSKINISDEYLSYFSADGKLAETNVVNANSHAFEKVTNEIKAWHSGEEEDHSAAIFGDKGIGKTTFLNNIEKKLKDLKTIRIKIPPKITSKEKLNKFFLDALGFEETDNLVKSILNFNSKVENHTVILIDDAHNLFLGKYKGFEALNAFIDIVNLKVDKLYWVSAFNSTSWAYIKGVLGSFQYIRNEVFLDGWSDESIKDLILSRHRLLDYKLSYDQIILATQTGSTKNQARIKAEEQFFRLLWEQSDGNPRVALFLWVNCLRAGASKTLNVSLPEAPKTKVLESFDDSVWFVLAAIAKHENLTRTEAADATNLTWTQVAHALKLGVENKIIYKGDGNRFRLHFTYLQDVLNQLKVKNFIYGID